jgi:Flp pilus assembly protein TadB
VLAKTSLLRISLYLAFVANVKQMMNADATALMVLALLALGTFTAGIQTDSWRICLVGLVLGLAVPAVAWLEQSTLLLLLVAVVLGAFAILLFSYYRGRHADIKNEAKPNR